jgi:RNA polymerase sigma-70 factor (ECF subfamily)
MITTTANEASLFCQLLKTKSQSAFAELYDKYAAGIYGVICKNVQNTNVAEQVLQEVFIKAWRNIDDYDASKKTLFIWLLNITRNTCTVNTETPPNREQQINNNQHSI